MQLILSLFTGIGLLDEAFKREGFCVVSAGDIITGQDIRNFTTTDGHFDGVIGSPPCQDFSTRQLHSDKTNYSHKMVEEFKRIVLESKPKWWLLESIHGVPDVIIEGYNHQRTPINQAWYEAIYRKGIIQFGSNSGQHIQIPRGKICNNLKRDELKAQYKSFAEIKHMKGLPDSFDLPGLTISAKKSFIGNTVPLKMGEVIAKAVKSVMCPDQSTANYLPSAFINMTPNTEIKYCNCGCGNVLYGRKKYHSAACRKAAQRKRERSLLQSKLLDI